MKHDFLPYVTLTLFYPCATTEATFSTDPKAARLLDIDFDRLVDDVIFDAVVSFAGKHPYYGRSSECIMYAVMRDKFDHALLKRAQEAGTHVLQGIEARAIHISSRGVEVFTSVGEFTSEFIVGADGARSRVAKAMGAANHRTHIAGIEAEVKVGSEDLC